MMDACGDPKNREVVIMSAAQLGKSEALLNVIGYHIDNDPCPMLMLQPSLDMAQAFSKDRVANGLLSSTPCLRSKVKSPRSRDSGNTTLHKIFPGGAITLVGANSSASLASRPIRLVLCDEVDRYPASAGSEGDPIALAKKRAATFWDRKVVMVSTPTIKGASRIEEAFEKSDQRHYHVACPHCDHKQKLVWANVEWTDNDPDTAAYRCEDCSVLWTETDRRKAIRGGEWVAEEPFNGIAGFAISALYSPWTPLSDGVMEFLAVRKNPEQLKVWTNTYLGQSWEDEGEKVDEYNLMDRKEDFAEKIPEECLILTAGVDVQDDRLEISTIGWGKDDESWVIDHKVMYGDPSTPQLWTSLDTHIFQTFTTHDDREIPIRAVCVDSGGHYTNSVYAYAKKNAGRRVFAIKGVGGEGRPIVSRPSKNNIGKCPLFPIGVDTTKDLLFARLRINEVGAGYIHFSDILNEEYFRQLTAEKIVTKYHRGFKKRIFQKIRPRNEALDCFVYAIAAYAIIGININALAEREARGPVKKPEAPKNQPFVPKSGKSFVNSWR